MEVILGMHAIQSVLSVYHQISALSWSQHMNKKKVFFFFFAETLDRLVKNNMKATQMWFYRKMVRTPQTNKMKISCEN